MDAEGAGPFDTVRKVNDASARYYAEHYLAGQSATLYDMRNIVSLDTKTVNLWAIIGIFVVLLLAFKSLTAPVFLIFTIESAIWLNLSFAYFSDQAFNFIGYLVHQHGSARINRRLCHLDYRSLSGKPSGDVSQRGDYESTRREFHRRSDVRSNPIDGGLHIGNDIVKQYYCAAWRLLGRGTLLSPADGCIAFYLRCLSGTDKSHAGDHTSPQFVREKKKERS